MVAQMPTFRNTWVWVSIFGMSERTKTFGGLRVAAFESRRAEEISRLITRLGGLPQVSPSMREVPLEDTRPVIDFANQLITGQVDAVIVMTGVGFRHLLRVVERHVDRDRFLEALSDITTIARGPKAMVAMNEVGLKPTHRVPNPNTWREVLNTADREISIANQTIGLQEYGKTNPSLIAGLEARGARVIGVKVYRWDLPLDCEPLKKNLEALCEKRVDVVLFTSANQVTHALQVAESMGILPAVQEGIRAAVTASIGPTTTEMLQAFHLPVDIESEQGKMGQLVAASAERAESLLARKKQIMETLSSPVSGVTDPSAPWYDSPFMKACRGEPTEVTPVWLMRQAGRYLPEYRAVRKTTTFLELCKNPALCAEVMVTTVNRLGVDAAIIFSDLLPILEPMGLELEYAAGEGPIIHNPLREGGDVDRLLELESVDALHFVTETVRLTRSELPANIPLIGFAGAPFTLASYAIEGGSSRNHLNTKTLMYRDEGAWRALMERLTRAVTLYLNAQISAGAQCVQLFDSWVGCLGPEDYRRYVLPYVQQIISDITAGVPVISFSTGNPALLPLLAEGGSSVVGADWRVRLDEAWRMIGHDRAIQGNLEPAALLADRQEIRQRVQAILDQAQGRQGHIFNLGHGVLQQTPVDNVVAMVDLVHALSQR